MFIQPISEIFNQIQLMKLLFIKNLKKMEPMGTH